MRKILFTFLILYSSLACKAQKISIFGYINDSTNGEALMYSSCYDSINSVGITSNAMGYFNLKVKKGEKVALKITHIGYSTQSINLIPFKDTTINIHLSPKQEQLEEVVVSEYASIQKQDILGKITVPIKTIQSIPSFVGIPDLMKAITFIPGVSGGREGYSNIYVRGGDRGQNLVLLDGIKLYNTNHVGGFLSLLNSDVLKHVDVYKGGFPARYGGRASSIIDIYSKDGGNDKMHGKVNLGILNSSLILEGPIGKQLTFFIAGRTSYYNLLNLASTDIDDSGSEIYKYNFHDINSKMTWQIHKNHKLSLSLFTSKDKQTYDYTFVNSSTRTSSEGNGMNIETKGASMLYRGKISQRLFMENLVAYSSYNNSLYTSNTERRNNLQIVRTVNSSSDIEDYSAKSRFDFYQSNNYSLRTGIEASHYRFTPGLQNNFYENNYTNVLNDTTIGFINKLKSTEISLYQENEIDITPNLQINIGVRGIGYFCKDTSFFRFEPRLSLRWLAAKNLSFKGNFTKMNQFNHVLVNNVEGFEREIWFSATKELLPQQAQQVSVGVFYGNENLHLDFSVEAFYKKMQNLQEYKSPVMDENSLDNISNIVAKNGIGKARGFELYAKKDFTRLNLNLNYTLSWSDRQFDELNNGEWYPFLYDRRHDLSLISLFNINKKYSIGANFIFTTGAAVTLPVGFSKHDDLVYQYYIYESMNNKRLPPYHRLDLSVTRKTTTSRGNTSKWTLNIFNAYARQNPVYIYYDTNTGKVYQKSLFSIVPTINYSLEF